MLLILACAEPAPIPEPVDPLEWSLEEAGPYAVGFRSWPITYVPEGETEARTILVNLWYPTEADEGDDVFYGSILPDPQALGDAPPAAAAHAGGYPVLLYSHGWPGFGGASAFLMRHFASHGWIAVASDHTGNTLLDHKDPLPTSHYVARPQDVSAALDAVVAGEGDLPGAVDDGAVLMSGHSFGVTTSWGFAGAAWDADALAAACQPGGAFPEGACTEAEVDALLAGAQGDPRVAGTILMAGSIERRFFGSGGHAAAQGAFLAMSGSEDPVGAQEQFDSTAGLDLAWIELAGGCHQTFAVGTCSSLDTELGFSLVSSYALAFGRAVILGDGSDHTAALLAGQELLDPVIQLRRHGP